MELESLESQVKNLAGDKARSSDGEGRGGAGSAGVLAMEVTMEVTMEVDVVVRPRSRVEPGWLCRESLLGMVASALSEV